MHQDSPGCMGGDDGQAAPLPADPSGVDPSAERRLQQLLTDLARAADLCLRPWRHSLRFSALTPAAPDRVDRLLSEATLLIEVRDGDGVRHPSRDLELEIYRSAERFNLILSQHLDPDAPMLWYGSHPVWMAATDGLRCERPDDGVVLESFCRRVWALLATEILAD